jgi:hypothetical protein
MAQPDLRHFQNTGLFFISSDPVEVRFETEWHPAIWTDKGWFSCDGASKLIEEIKEWRHAQENEACGIRKPVQKSTKKG